MKSNWRILLVIIGLAWMVCIHADPPPKAYAPIYKKIDALTFFISGSEPLTLGTLQKTLSLKGSGVKVTYEYSTSDQQFDDIRYDAASFGDYVGNDVLIRVGRDKRQTIERFVVKFKDGVCINSESLRDRYQMTRAYPPDSGPGAKEALYEKKTGHGDIWLHSTNPADPSIGSCVTSFGMIFQN